MSKNYSSPSQDVFLNNNKNIDINFPLLIDYNNSSEKNIKSLTQNNIIKNSKYINTNKENINNTLNDNMRENILTVSDKCRRCRAHKPEIMCRECYPFIYFCLNCSYNLHSMESKKNHNIIPLKELNEEIYNEANRYNYINNNNNYLSNLDSLPKYTNNYINDIKDIYETEKNNLIKKSFSLEQNLENTKKFYDDKISELQEKITSLQNNKDVEIKIIEETKNYELKNIIEEKQNKINILIKRNEELNKFNEELIQQLSEYKEDLNKTKIKNIDIIQNQKEEIDRLNQDKNDLIKYYENKLNSMNNIYN